MTLSPSIPKSWIQNTFINCIILGLDPHLALMLDTDLYARNAYPDPYERNADPDPYERNADPDPYERNADPKY